MQTQADLDSSSENQEFKNTLENLFLLLKPLEILTVNFLDLWSKKAI